MCLRYDALEELAEEEVLDAIRSKGSLRPAPAARPPVAATA